MQAIDRRLRRSGEQRTAIFIGKTEAATGTGLLVQSAFAQVNDAVQRGQGWHPAVSRYRRPMAALAPA